MEQNPEKSFEKILSDRPDLKEKYANYLKKHGNVVEGDFYSWLSFFDFVLEESNSSQKQIKAKSVWLKKLNYQISLLYNRVKHEKGLSSIPWWNEITPFVYLGALPLKRNIKPLQKENIRAVVSMVEAFEQEDSCFGKPVRKDKWEEIGVDNIRFETPDFRPISLKVLYDATLFLKESVDQKKKSYVHCKAGRGRSASVVMTYLILFEGLSYAEAEKLIKSKRPHIDLENKKANIETLVGAYRAFFLQR